MAAQATLKRYLANREYVNERYDSLLHSHDGKYIAVRDGRVLAAAPSIETLREAIKRATLFDVDDGTAIVYMTSDTSSMLL